MVTISPLPRRKWFDEWLEVLFLLYVLSTLPRVTTALCSPAALRLVSSPNTVMRPAYPLSYFHDARLHHDRTYFR